MSLIYLLLAAVALSFLVFIHELAHYLVARRVGMRVEVFSIGFGPAFLSWKRGKEVWQICYLPFGGYVKFAGMDTEKGVDPHDVKDGFFGKSPLDRIKVAAAGPAINIVFALILFTFIWLGGGRLKPFEQYTNIIGWIDPKSELSQKGVGPGDTISSYDGEKFKGFKDLYYSAVMKGDSVQIAGDKIDYLTGSKVAYDYKLTPYTDTRIASGDFKTIGVEQPASYLLYDNFPGGQNPIAEASPMFNSGLQPGERLAWANGELLFSLPQLTHIVNSGDVMLTVLRDGKTHLARIPQVDLTDLRLSDFDKDEIYDWGTSSTINTFTHKTLFIPYMIDEKLLVTKTIPYVDEDLIEEKSTSSNYLNSLQLGDQVLAVAGREVSSPSELFNELQTRKVLLIASKVNDKQMTWENEDALFTQSIDGAALTQLISGIGIADGPKEVGSNRLLEPVAPTTKNAFLQKKEALAKNEAITSSQKNGAPLHILYGCNLQDRMVIYNPSPFQILGDAIQDTWRTITSLMMGKLSPKWLSGPVGFVRIVHMGWSTGISEALYWIGLISLNLGIMNLLPIPILDGGHICFSVYEAVTKKRIAAKTMERMLLPFLVLFIMLFVYVTYQDVSRLIGK